MVNKAKLVEKIAELVRDKRVEGITDLRDESNKKFASISLFKLSTRVSSLCSSLLLSDIY